MKMYMELSEDEAYEIWDILTEIEEFYLSANDEQLERRRQLMEKSWSIYQTLKHNLNEKD